MGMKFKVADLRMQMKDIATIAKPFLKRGYEQKLIRAADDLDQIYGEIRRRMRASRHQPNLPPLIETWQIEKDDPIVTRPNKGNHERKQRRGAELIGSLSFKWKLTYAEENVVELAGLASTKLKVFPPKNDATGEQSKETESQSILTWHVDVVPDEEAPGPAIHAQIISQANLSVPRLPSILFTPADCLDFLLGELFQDEWEQRLASHNYTASFAKAQQHRIRQLLQDHDSRLKKLGKLSAWISFKNSRPSDDLFLTS